MARVRRCKKCSRILPEGYKHKRCTNCRKASSDTVKAVILFIPMVCATVIKFVIKK